MELIPEAQLFLDIRREADAVGSDFVDDVADLRPWLKTAYKAFLRRMLAARGRETFVRSDRTSSTSNGVTLYALPTDLFELVAMRVEVGSSWVPLAPFTEGEVPELRETSLATVGYPLRFRDRAMFPIDGATAGADQVELLPAPKAAYRLEFVYVPYFQTTSTGISYFGFNGLEQRAVYDVAAKIYEKRRRYQDANAKLARMAAVDEEIVELAQLRARPAGELVDVYAGGGPWGCR